ncbi:MAG: hypothetical protein R3A10_23265 [Caldilineaceae bacterium]
MTSTTWSALTTCPLWRPWLDPTQNCLAVRTGDGDLIGFCCFGADARALRLDYADGALDVGIGMRPDLTVRGVGMHSSPP